MCCDCFILAGFSLLITIQYSAGLYGQCMPLTPHCKVKMYSYESKVGPQQSCEAARMSNWTVLCYRYKLKIDP